MIHLNSTDDPALRPYTGLKDRQLAAEMGLFVCEGEHNVRRLLASSFKVHSLLIADHRWEAWSETVPDGVDVYVASNDLLSNVVGFQFHLGVLACGVRPSAASVDTLLPSTTLVCLPEIRNAENLGLIVRAAHGLGAGGLLLSDIGCDPFTRRVIRVSMGSVFGLPIVRSVALVDDLKSLRDQYDMSLIAATLDGEPRPLQTFRRPEDAAGMVVLLGNEPDGLAPHWVGLCDHRVSIPMSAGVDSLNVAVAAGIFLHHLAQ